MKRAGYRRAIAVVALCSPLVTGSTGTSPAAGADGIPDAEAIVEPLVEKPADGAGAVRAVKSILTGSLLLQGLAMVSGVELARGLTGRGDVAAAMLWPTVIGGIGVLGLEESMTYHIASARDRRDVGRLLG